MTTEELLKEFKKVIEKITTKEGLNELREEYATYLEERKEKQKEFLTAYRNHKNDATRINLVYNNIIISETYAKIRLIDNQLYILELEKKSDAIINDCVASINAKED